MKQYPMAIRDMKTCLQLTIDRYLMHKRASLGGWAPVEQVDLDQLLKIISLLIDLKFQADPDGDRPINVSLVNRNVYEKPLYWPVPYEHKAKTPEEKAKVFKHLLINLRCATDAMDTYLQLNPELPTATPATTTVLTRK